METLVIQVVEELADRYREEFYKCQGTECTEEKISLERF